MWSRRGILLAGGALVLTGCDAKVMKTISKVSDFASRMIEITKRHGGKVGVSCTSGTASNHSGLNIESDQRFAHCSTFKWVLATAILSQVDAGKLKLSQAVRYGKADMLDYAPVTKANLAKGQMSLADLCAAAVEQSDNTAANLLLPLVGGPAGLTAFVRGLGDSVTRFDRNEPSLNSNVDGDERDTTTPSAMAGLLQTVFTGATLKPESLDKLKGWMIACTTGNARIRAGVPAGYTVGDKTGTGENGAVNDVAVIWPPAGSKIDGPLFLAIYTSGGNLDAAGRDKVIADTTKLVFDTLDFAESLDSESEEETSESPAASIS